MKSLPIVTIIRYSLETCHFIQINSKKAHIFKSLTFLSHFMNNKAPQSKSSHTQKYIQINESQSSVIAQIRSKAFP
jgi:hypothetical protein